MKILFLTTVLPFEQETGGEIASQNFLAALRDAGHIVKAYGYVRNDDSSSSCLDDIPVCVRSIETKNAGWIKYFWYIKCLFLARPYIIQKFISREYEFLLKKYDFSSIDIVIVDHTQMEWVLRFIPKHLPVIYVVHNAESILYGDKSKDKKISFLNRAVLAREAKLALACERRLAQRAVQAWTLVDSEAKYIQGLNSTIDAKVMHLPGKIPNIHNHVTKDIDIGLLGTWAWHINRAGLDWFLEKVLPLLPKNKRLVIAGKGTDDLKIKYPIVEFLGYVNSSEEFYQRCRVFAVPTTVGAGIQLKTIEAISHGVRVVTTTLGLRGIGSLPSYVDIADTPSLYAEKLLNLCHYDELPDGAGINWYEERRIQFVRDIKQALSRFN